MALLDGPDARPRHPLNRGGRFGVVALCAVLGGGAAPAEEAASGITRPLLPGLTAGLGAKRVAEAELRAKVIAASPPASFFAGTYVGFGVDETGALLHFGIDMQVVDPEWSVSLTACDGTTGLIEYALPDGPSYDVLDQMRASFAGRDWYCEFDVTAGIMARVNCLKDGAHLAFHPALRGRETPPPGCAASWPAHP